MEFLGSLLGLFGFACFSVCFLVWLFVKIPGLKGRFGHYSRRFRYGIFGGLAAFLLALFLFPSDTTEVSEQIETKANTEVQSDSSEALNSTPIPIEADEVLDSTPLTTEAAVNFVSDPVGATLYIDDEMEGQTPVSVNATVGAKINYRLVADDTFAEYDLYKPFNGSLEVAEDDSVSVWIERTTGEEQEAQKVSYQQEQEAAVVRESEKRLRNNDLQYLLGPACEDLVKNVLKAPSTAKFPGIFSSGESFWVDYDAGKAYFTSYVDAQNSFGAMLRNDFSCSYDASSDTVSLDYFE